MSLWIMSWGHRHTEQNDAAISWEGGVQRTRADFRKKGGGRIKGCLGDATFSQGRLAGSQVRGEREMK